MKTLSKKLSIAQILLQVIAIIIAASKGLFGWNIHNSGDIVHSNFTLLGIAPAFFYVMVVCAIVTVITCILYLKNSVTAKWHIIAPCVSVITLVVVAILHLQTILVSEDMDAMVQLAIKLGVLDTLLVPMFYVELSILLASAIISFYTSFRKADTDGELEADATSVQ